MPKVFTVSYLAKDKDLSFEGKIGKALNKCGYGRLNTYTDDNKVRVLLFGKKEHK